MVTEPINKLLSRSNSVLKFILLVIVLGIVKTLLVYPGFGVVDQVEQLPLIYRSMDGSYLTHDFFTNVGSESIARRYYSEFIAFICPSKNQLPLVFLILTMISNILISVLTFCFARSLFKSNLAGVIASVFVMTISTFLLGYGENIYVPYLIPTTLAVPFCFFAILLSVNKHTGFAILSGGIASIFHPVLGLEVSALILLSSFISGILLKERIPELAKKLIVPSFVFIPFVLLSLLPQLNQDFKLDPKQFVYILAFFRLPHHYIPSSFPVSEYLVASGFVFVFFYSWYNLKQTVLNDYKTNFILVLNLAIIISCIVGYLFVEVFPLRTVTYAQTFRLLFFMKWIGLIYIAAFVVEMFKKKNFLNAYLYLLGSLHPLVLGFAMFTELMEDKVSRYLALTKHYYKYPLLIFCLVCIYMLISIYTILLFIIFLVLYVIFNRLSMRWISMSFLGVVLLLFLTVIIYKDLPIPVKVKSFISSRTASFSMRINPELDKSAVELAEFVKQNTPQDAIFLTPCNYGQFRLLAERAIVVDYKGVPFTDKAILEWYNRINNCYGHPKHLKSGWANASIMLCNYKLLDDTRLKKLKEKYNFSYAVLFKETKSNYTVLFQNDLYKVVVL